MERLGILLSGEMVSLEKHPVFLDCYRFALGRAPSCKTVFNAVQSERGTGNHHVEVSLTVGLVLDMSIARSSVSYHIKILECVHGFFAQ